MTIATIIPSLTSSPPSRANPAAFPTDGDSFLNDLAGIVSAQNTAASELTAWNSEIETFKNQSAASETNAESSKNTALTQARNAAASQVSLWVSGTTYAVNQMVYSSVDGRQYKRILAGAGTTDPSSDPTNWEPLGWEYITNYPDIRPTLNLDFANTKILDPRITFTRASEARYYDASTVALAEQNLLSYSNNPAAAWVAISGGATLTSNAGVAPDGTNTATSVNVTNYGIRRSFNFTSGVQYTVSAYLRSVSGDTTFSADLQNAQVSPTFTLTSSWQRFTWTVTASAAHTWLDFQLAGAGVFEVWGVQLEQRSQATALTPTTAQPITNYIPVLQTAANGVARFDHNPVTRESLGLLIEEQRTNLLTFSEQFDNAAWNKNSTTVTPDVIVAPDGTLSGDLLTQTGDGSRYIRQVFGTSVGTTKVISVYAKAAGTSTLKLGSGQLSAYATFNLSDGTVLTGGSAATIQAVGNGWYRCAFAVTDSTTLVGYEICGVNNGDNFYIWGAQLEAGSFPTSYIPTTTAQVTRAADAAFMTGTNFSSWYRQDEGSFVYTAFASFGSGAEANYVVGLGSANNNSFAYAATYELRRNFSTPSLNEIGQTYSTKRLVSAIAFSTLSNTASAAMAGVLRNDNTSGFYTGTDKVAVKLGIGNSARAISANVAGAITVKKLAYYPKRLPNLTLQAITQP